MSGHFQLGQLTIGPRARLAILAALAVTAMLLLSGAASSAPISSGSAGVSIIAQNGFGDRNNSYAWSMDWFAGKLYVGTGRDELCVENETLQFYYPHAGLYTTNPSPGVRCAKKAYDMPLRAEIWQYTPPSGTNSSTTTTTTLNGTTKITVTHSVASTGRWKMVYRAPLIGNPMAPGKPVARDLAYRGMVVWKNPQGHQALFAAGVSPDEYLPPLLQSHPPVLMRSFDGVHWQTLHMPSVVVHFPNGNVRAMGFRSLLVWNGHLLVTATPDITGDGALFEVTRPWSGHPGLRQVSGPQYDIFEIQKFANALYIGTGSKRDGYGVYRTYKYTPHGEFEFRDVVRDGAGRGHAITSVVSMKVYHHRLYVGSSGWYDQNTIPASEMIRIAPNGQWTLVVGNTRTLRSGRAVAPVSGLQDGFNSPFAAHFWRMADQGAGLFVGTNDWAYLVQEDPQYAWLQETVLSGVLGFNVWATCDGNDWFAVTRDAFSGDEYNFGGRNLQADPSGRNLYIGSANQAQGTTIFDDQADSCGSLVNDVRGAARPGTLMTDNVRQGTLLSWQPAARASRYEVMRAPFLSVTLGLKAPSTVPDGWQFDDAMPTVTGIGAPGSTTVTLSLPGAFTPVAQTTSPYFVDPRRGHYVYEVVAKTAAGASSGPSNIEVTPFGGAPATFGALQSTLGGPTPAASEVRAMVAADHVSRLQRLVTDASTASGQGRRGVALSDVRRLQALAGDNDALSAVAARVARRLQYANLAGAP